MVEGNNGQMEPSALCKYCQKTKYKAHPGYGTSNAKKHLEICAEYKAFLVENPECSSDFDQKVFCRKFAEAIMYHSYPLSMVEHVKMREFLTYLNPKVRHITRNTILKYCLLEHKRLKHILFESLAQVNSRICFTCDLWSACTSRGFLTLTAHFIDNEWNLKSRILNFKYFAPPHRGVDIYLFVLALIKEWKLENKVFSMTCDNASSMDSMVSKLKFDLQHSLPVGGEHFHVRCCAHILNLIVQSGMSVIDTSVVKVRQAVNYICGSDSRLSHFDKCRIDVKSAFKGKLRLDCPTRWNSTYLMLKKALEAKDVLNLLDDVDNAYEYGLSAEEWDMVSYVCTFLEPFYELTVMFSGSDYPTSNLYFVNILAIEKLLEVGHTHCVASIRLMAKDMFKKFEKYWSEYSVILSIALVLDPRFKLVRVKAAKGKLYTPKAVEEKVTTIYDAFVKLYKFYEESSPSTSASFSRHRPSSSVGFTLSSVFEDDEENHAHIGSAEASVNAYLDAPLMAKNTPDFDILEFWKSQKHFFPVLCKMAKDILAIPITSVASESSFSMGGRVLTKYRSCLRTENVEAFVTTQNWLYGYLKEDEVAECFDIMKKVLPNDIDVDDDSLSL